MNQFLKNTGSILFNGNRTKPKTVNGAYSDYTPRAMTPALSNFVYSDKKSDITVQPNSLYNLGPTINSKQLKMDGGYVIYDGVTPIAYESYEVGTGVEGSGYHAAFRISCTLGKFNNQDKITIGENTFTLVNDGTNNTYNRIYISPSSLSDQINSIVNHLYYYGSQFSSTSKLNFYNENNSIAGYSKNLNALADQINVGVMSSNPDITVSRGVLSSSKSFLQFNGLRFESITAGSEGNNLSVVFSSGATNLPVVSTNGNGAITIQLKVEVSTLQDVVSAVNSEPTVNNLVLASLLGASDTLAVTSSSLSLEGGAFHKIIPWQRGDKLKNAFIPSPKLMYGYHGSAFSSFTEVIIPGSTTLHQTYHSLQIMSHPSHNYGSWFRKNDDKKATVELPNRSSFVYAEMEMMNDGVLGNEYSFEIRNSPDVAKNMNSVSPKFILESNINGLNKKIVLVLGTRGNNEGYNPSISRTFSSHNDFNQALFSSDENVVFVLKNLIRFNSFGGWGGFSSPSSEVFFSGGSSSDSFDLVREGVLDWHQASCRFNTHAGYFALGEIGLDGKSKIADDIQNSLQKGGKIGGMFANVVPAGTPFKSMAYIGDLELRAVSGGISGNNLRIVYVAGATAGSEVVSISEGLITIQIEDIKSTAQQVMEAINSHSIVSTLVISKIIGTPNNTQSIAMSPSPISFKGGAEPLAKDSGFFITTRWNVPHADSDLVNRGYYTHLEVWFSKDMSDPSAFVPVALLDQLDLGNLNITGGRMIFKIEDVKENGRVGLRFFVYNNHSSTTPPSVVRWAGNAHITNGRLRIESTQYGFSGNYSAKVQVLHNVPAGSETATLESGLITISAGGNSTILQIKNAIAANPEVAALITAKAELTLTDADTMGSSFPGNRYLLGGMDHWSHEGYWGFGYCNISEKDVVFFHSYRNENSTDNPLRKSPRNFVNDMVIESFRLTKIS